MNASTLLKDKKVLGGIVLIIILAVAFATAVPEDDDDKRSKGIADDTEKEIEIETFEFSGVATGLVGFGFNGEHQFEVREGAFKVIVNLSGEATSGMEDLDLELDGATGGHTTSGQPGTEESIEINRMDISRRYGYGDYTTTVVAYVAAATNYDVHVEVWYEITTA